MVSEHCIEVKQRRKDNDDDENDDDDDDDKDKNNNNNNKYYPPQVLLKRLHKSLKLLNLHSALYILKQKAVILNICCIVRKFLAEQCMRSAGSVRPILF